MAAVRAPGDPWHTALYRDPRRFWWAPGLVLLVVLLAFNRLVIEQSWGLALITPVILGGVNVLATWVRHDDRRGDDRARSRDAGNA